MANRATRATDHLVGAVGRATSLHEVMTTVPGHGWIAVRQGKGPLATSPHRWDRRHARVVSVVRRHSQKVHGCQGKGVHVLVPRPRAMQTTGGPAGGHLQATGVVNRRSSDCIRRDSSVGTRAQPTNSHQQLLTCRYLVDATSVATWDATPFSMGSTPCLHTHRPWIASSVANGDVT